MFRFIELAVFSIFFVFSFIKLFFVNLLDIDTLTYIYYFILMIFLFKYFLRNSLRRIDYMFLILIFSIAWLSLIGFVGMRSEAFAFGKLRSLTLSLLSIPIAAYMYRRDLIASAAIVTTVSISLLTILFWNYGTHDEADPAYVLNSVYLHGSFLAGLMVLFFSLRRLSVVWSLALIICMVILGARGPMLSLSIVFVSFVVLRSYRLIKKSEVKKQDLVFYLGSLPALAACILYFIPSLFDRMIARWSNFASGGDSTGRRIEHIYTSIAAFEESPIIGIGIANYGLFLEGYHNDAYPHNFLFEILVENGLLGGLPFLACVALIFLRSMKNRTWPILTYVLSCLLMSYSYVESNELYFVLTLAIIYRDLKKNENTRNHHGPSF